MEIHELNTKALSSPAYVAADDGDDTYKFDFNAVKTQTDSQIAGLNTSVTGLESDVSGLEDRPKIWYGTSVTTSSDVVKEVTCADFVLKNGDYLVVLFSQDNNVDTPKLNVNSTGAYYVVNGIHGRPFNFDAGTSFMFRIRYQSNVNEWYFDNIGAYNGSGTSFQAGTIEQLETGTDVSNRVWKPKTLHDYVADAVVVSGGAAPSTAIPSMDGTGYAGTSNLFARGDHRHPKDTTKADKATTVTNVAFDSENARITKTINGNTSKVINMTELKTALDLNNVINVEQAPKATAVTDVEWDTSAYKLTKTINGVTSDISILPGLLNRGTITAFDNATTTGFYTYSSSATNRPPISAGGACLVLHASNAFITQICFPNRSSSTATPTFYIRRSYSAGNWQAWYQIVPTAT